MAHSSAVMRSFLFRLLRWCVNTIWYGVLTILILVALYVGLGRQVMGNLNHFKTEIEQQISSVVGQPVSIERIRGGWRGLDPILRVEGVELAGVDGGRAVASLGELRLRLDSWASLRRLRIVLSEFAVRNGDASLIQQPDGRVGVEGLWLPPEPGIQPYGLPDVAVAASESFEARLGRWIDELGNVLSDPAVSVENLRLRVKPAGSEASEFVVPRMDVRFEDGIFRASGRLSQDGRETRTGLFALRGRHFFSGGFTGRLYLELNSGRFFDALLRHYRWRDLSIARVDADAKGWFGFSNGQLTRASGEVDLPLLDIRAKDTSIEPLRDLKLRGGWERKGDGWEAQLVSNGHRWKDHETAPSAARLRSSEGELSVQASVMELAPLCEFATATGVLPPELNETLVEHQPRGRLRNLDMNVRDAADWQMRGELEGVGAEAVGGSPHLRDLDGFVEAGPDSGRVLVAPGTLELGFPKLFAGPWTFTRMSGQVSWERRPDGWWIGSHNLAGQYDGAVAEGAFGLRVRDSDDDTLSLRVGITEARTDMLGALVPREIVPGQLYDFLTRDVGEGRIDHGWYYGHGTVGDDLDYDGFTSAMQYSFEETGIAYHPDWPRLEKAAGDVRVQGDKGIVSLRRGRIGGVDLEPSRVLVTPAARGVRVDIDTGVRRQREFLTDQWRQSDPLRELLGGWIQDASLTGPVAADLDMSIWPEMARDTEFDLNLELDGAGFDFAPASLRWRDLTGDVRYSSQSGIEPTVLDGRFLDRPVTIEVAESDDTLVARQKGTASVDSIEAWSARKLPWLSGDLDYEASFRPTEGPLLRLDADLGGVESSLPEPLDKSAGDAHSLTTTLDFSREERVVVDGNWNPLGAFRMAFVKGVLERGSVALGVRSTRLPDEPVLFFTGPIPRLSLDEWAGIAVPGAEDREPEPGSGAGMAAVPPLRFNFAVDALDAVGRSMGRVRLEGNREDAGWRVGVEGDRVDGVFRIPEGSEAPVAVELDNLDVPEPDNEPDSGAGEDSGERFAPASWPQADVRVGNFRFQGRDFRDVRFRVRPGAAGMALRDMRLSMGDLELAGDLSWELGGDPGSTEFSGTLTGGSLKGLEALLGQPVPIRNRNTDARVDFAWPGGPMDFELASLNAEFGFRLENGTIDEQSDASRLFRVFGLLNTDTIWRRLQLDFSDVYESGIAFDHMEGNALIHEGRLIFDPKVLIQAPSGGFRMSGEADLIEETLNMRLVVVLPITQNLPLAAVLFGFAPPVGGALFVIDQVFGGMLSRVTSATYSVGGTWNDPDVSLRNLFDTESDLSDYERPEMDLETGEFDDPAEEIRR